MKSENKPSRIQEPSMYANRSTNAHDFPDDLIQLVSLFVEDITEHLPTAQRL